MWATIEKGVSIANRRVYPAIISILRIYLDNTSLCTLRILCFFKHNDWIHDSSFGDQTILDVNKNIFPYKSQVIKARPIVLLLHSVNQDSITLSLSLSLSSLNPLYGSLPRSRTVLHRLHYETSQYKENANLFATGCEAVTSMNRSQLYLWKSSKKKSMDVLTLSSLQTFESRMTMDVNQRKILVDEVQKIERNGVYDVRNALSARFIPEGILSLRATIIPSRFGTLWKWLFPSFLGGGGYKLAATSHTILSLWPRWVYIPKAERRNATRRFSSQPRECVRNLDVALSAVNAFP